MAFEMVETDNVRSAGGRPYSPALRVGDHLYLSGQVPIDGDGNTVGPGDPAAQWRQCFENIKELVEAAGATMADMYFLTIYVTDMRVYMDHGEIRKEYLSEPLPGVNGGPGGLAGHARLVHRTRSLGVPRQLRVGQNSARWRGHACSRQLGAGRSAAPLRDERA